ncbi:MAG: type I-B CRISPR-associated protein Cas7/Cst2/DevR [Acidobacteria bacterium]|nr:type I-B CRISPR-associated protein Cas7/Cst2/DevR [Acidobacteriota bacterium]
MGKQEKARKNVFGTVLTDVMPSSNYRGDTEDNRSVLQKLRYADGDHTVFSAEAIRNRLREMLREDGLPSNRSRLKSQKELTVHYDKFPNANNFADDKLFGFLALSKEEKDFQGDTALRVNYAISLDPFPLRSRQTMHQSPKIEGAFKNAKSSALIYREVHVSAYQYPFGMNLNDLDDKDNPEQTKQWKEWGATLFRAIGELNGVAGNHARTMFPFGPVSIVMRLTARRTPDFDLYGFKTEQNESQRELLEGLADGRLPKEEFYIGGRIAREHAELKELLTSNDAQSNGEQLPLNGNKLMGVKVFKTAEAAIEALIKDAGLETET